MKKGNVQNREHFLSRFADRVQEGVPAKRENKAKPISSIYNLLEKESIEDVFIENARTIHAETIRTNKEDLTEVLESICKNVAKDQILSSIQTDNKKLENWTSKRTVQWTPKDGYQNVTSAAQSRIGITYCDIALAESGTVVLMNEKNKGRSVSLLPEVHVVIIPKSRIVPRLKEAMEIINGRVNSSDSFPTCVNFITGPSNSADIEFVLVVGVHGPLETIYVLVEDE